MSWSKIDICNMALAKAGHSQLINSLDYSGGSTAVPQEVQMCLLYWGLAFEATARSHPWNCLLRQADISASITTAPAFGYSYAYSLPADYLGWLRFEDPDVTYRRVGRTIHTDETDVDIWYVARTEDTDLYDPLFVEALVMRLAAHLVPAFQGENSLQRAQELTLWHERVSLPAARFADSAEGMAGTWESTEWLDSRSE